MGASNSDKYFEMINTIITEEEQAAVAASKETMNGELHDIVVTDEDKTALQFLNLVGEVSRRKLTRGESVNMLEFPELHLVYLKIVPNITLGENLVLLEVNNTEEVNCLEKGQIYTFDQHCSKAQLLCQQEALKRFVKSTNRIHASFRDRTIANLCSISVCMQNESDLLNDLINCCLLNSNQQECIQNSLSRDLLEQGKNIHA